LFRAERTTSTSAAAIRAAELRTSERAALKTRILLDVRLAMVEN
jgi:hypothetical protein